MKNYILGILFIVTSISLSGQGDNSYFSFLDISNHLTNEAELSRPLSNIDRVNLNDETASVETAVLTSNCYASTLFQDYNYAPTPTTATPLDIYIGNAPNSLVRSARLKNYAKLVDGGFPIEVRARMSELFDVDGVPKVKLKEGSPVDGEIEFTFSWDGEEITEPFLVIEDLATGELRFRFKNFVEKGHLYTFPTNPNNITENLIPRTIPDNPLTNIAVNLIKLMQKSINNSHGNGYFVLKNFYELKIGSLTVEQFFPLENQIRLFENLDPSAKGTWTVDHRRLMAVKLAGIENIPVTWVDPIESVSWPHTYENPDWPAPDFDPYGHAFKMSNTSGGSANIELRVHLDSNGKFVNSSSTPETWKIEQQADESFKILRPNGSGFIEVPFNSLPNFW